MVWQFMKLMGNEVISRNKSCATLCGPRSVQFHVMAHFIPTWRALHV